jgi:hypothetical protein
VVANQLGSDIFWREPVSLGASGRCGGGLGCTEFGQRVLGHSRLAHERAGRQGGLWFALASIVLAALLFLFMTGEHYLLLLKSWRALVANEAQSVGAIRGWPVVLWRFSGHLACQCRTHASVMLIGLRSAPRGETFPPKARGECPTNGVNSTYSRLCTIVWTYNGLMRLPANVVVSIVAILPLLAPLAAIGACGENVAPLAVRCGSGTRLVNGTCIAGGEPTEAGTMDAEEPDVRVCTGLECSVHACEGGKTTSISGKVFDPAGTAPLYNVTVYVANAPLEKVVNGAACATCGPPIASPVGTVARTNERGEFRIDGVPDGADIPLVFQIGKWRRKIMVDVLPCVDNAFVDPQQMRLPRKQTEGDMPQLAITTGGCDPFACLFAKIGIAAEEFTGATGTGRVHIYKGTGGQDVTGGMALDPQTDLWNDVNKLRKYDMVGLSCECSEHIETKPPASKAAMRDYLNAGGRLLATHYHYTWFKDGPAEFSGLANWTPPAVVPASEFDLDTSFPGGKALSDWLFTIGASPTPGKVVFTGTANDMSTVNTGARRWISSGSGNTEAVKVFTFDTPVGAPPASQCGRAAFSDVHVTSVGATTGPVPSSCDAMPLTPQERALEFLFFELSVCK